MSSGASTAPRQGVRGSGSLVTINQSTANARLRRLMERLPRGGRISDSRMRALATRAGFNPRRFQ